MLGRQKKEVIKILKLIEKDIFSKLHKTASAVPVASVLPGMDYILPSFFLK